MKVSYITVLANDAGQRIDNYLIKKYKDVPKARLYRAVRKGEVRVNKKRVKQVYRLCEGDILRIPPFVLRPVVPLSIGAQQIKTVLDMIIYEDQQLLVVNKAAGLAVHKGTNVRAGVIEILQAHYGSDNLHLVHRLDRATSGCLLLAKDRQTLLQLQEQLKDRSMRKSYQALVQGRYSFGDNYRVDAPLYRLNDARPDGPKIMVDQQRGQSATTYFNLEYSNEQASLLTVGLATGRMHQIRVHSAYMGHPIAGDLRYGNVDFNRSMAELGLRRMFLHASCVEFSLGAKQYKVSAALDAELEAILQRLF
jgi:23S rRNA pseudouridine955/2504/2580 synthase